MATFKKVAGGWQAQVHVNGIRKAKTRPTKAEARSWAAQTEHELSQQVEGVLLSKSLTDAFRKYAEEVSPGKKGANWEIIRLKKFERDPIADLMLVDLRREHFDDFIKRSSVTLKSSSINRELNLISHVLTECRRWRWVIHNPLADLKRPKNPPARNRLISLVEIDTLGHVMGYNEGGSIITPSQRSALAFLFAIETALRAGEICNLKEYGVLDNRTFKCIDLDANYIKVLDSKNGESRDVPLSPRAVELLKKLQPFDDGPVFKLVDRNLSKNFGNAVKRAGIVDLVFHDSRHEATTRLAKKLSVLELAKTTGHKNINELLTYYNETASEISKKLA